MENRRIELSKAEIALLKFWRSYVPSFDPNKRQYMPEVHSIENRTMVYYFMTEDLIEYFRKCNIPGAVGRALSLMHVQSSTLAEWRKMWRSTWAKMQIN